MQEIFVRPYTPASIHRYLAEIARKSDAEIRVSFKNQGSYSYVGTDALGIPADQLTINLGFVSADQSDRHSRVSILHEFEHVLGLLHEFQNPAANIPWDRPAVYSFFQRENGWTRELVDQMIFAPWQSKDLPPKEFDPRSVMMFAFPKQLLTSGEALTDNDQLSEGDKQYIAKLYPRN